MNDSQFGGRLPIGAAILMPAGGNLLTMGDGSIWLQTGTLASAASYPSAASVDHLKAHVLTTRGSGGSFGTTAVSLATDGAGRYLATNFSNSTHSLSVDGGVTWSTLSTGIGGSGPVAAYGGGKWVSVNNDTTKIYFSSSASAASGSWLGPTNQAILGGANSVAKVVWSGAQFVASCGQSGSYVFTSPDGATWTARTMTVGTPGNSTPFLAADGNRIVVSTTSAIFASVDAGATWSDVTPSGFMAAGPVYAINGRFFVFGNISVTSVDPSAASNWFTISLPSEGGSAPYSSVGFVSADRSQLTLLSAGGRAGIWLTSDGQTWRNRAVDATSVLANNSIYAFGANDMVIASTTLANTQPYRGSTSPVGAHNAIGKLPLQGGASGQLYVRVK